MALSGERSSSPYGSVTAVTNYLRARMALGPDPEARVRELMEQAGAATHRALQLDRVPLSLWARLRGKSVSPFNYYYEIPREWFVEMNASVPKRFHIPD
jgi:hypothetical protein